MGETSMDSERDKLDKLLGPMSRDVDTGRVGGSGLGCVVSTRGYHPLLGWMDDFSEERD